MATLTEGETPSVTFWSPCTIQGWRPFSVSSQPAVFITNGTGSTQMATRWNHLASASRLRQASHAPHSANRNIAAPE